ncbi:hypothetical protein HK096_006220, partial [Nowakowskiella sp. JEL0078]
MIVSEPDVYRYKQPVTRCCGCPLGKHDYIAYNIPGCHYWENYLYDSIYTCATFGYPCYNSDVGHEAARCVGRVETMLRDKRIKDTLNQARKAKGLCVMLNPSDANDILSKQERDIK